MATPALSPPPLGPRHWPVWLGIGLLWLAGNLPLGVQRVVGTWLGGLIPLFARARHSVATANIALCFPELAPAERDALCRRSLRELGRGLFEFARAWWGGLGDLPSRTRVEGLEHLQAALAQGRGVILLSGHFVHLELCARLLCEHVAVAGMYRPHEQPAMEWAVKRGRLRYAQAMFTRDELRPALKHLKSGGILWFAPDQDTRRGDSVFVPFFGRPAWSLTSTHQLARLSGAPVICFQHRRSADGRGFELRIHPPLDDFPSRDPAADTARVMAGIEAMVRDAPAEYLWVHKRFKRQPEGMAAPY